MVSWRGGKGDRGGGGRVGEDGEREGIGKIGREGEREDEERGRG